MFLLSGVARYLFVPLAEAVIFAVAASYILSRTLVPTLIMWFERNHHRVATATPSTGGQEKSNASGDGSDEDRSADGRIRRGEHVALWMRPFVVVRGVFERGFDRLRTGY